MKLFSSGIGATTGDSLLTDAQLQCTGDVWYVHFGTGVDGAGLGKQRLAPLKTLAQAYTNASDGDILCFLSGHEEALTAVQPINKKLILASEGTGIGAMAKFTRGVAGNGKLFDVTTNRVQLRNVYFAQSTTSSSGAKVAFSGTDCKTVNCYFAGGVADPGPQVDLVTGADRYRDEGSTFISVTTNGTLQPAIGVRISNALADVSMSGTIFSGGVYGWSGYALDATAAAQTRILLENISLLLDSDIGLHASSTGIVTLGTCSGSARVVHA